MKEKERKVQEILEYFQYILCAAGIVVMILMLFGEIRLWCVPVLFIIVSFYNFSEAYIAKTVRNDQGYPEKKIFMHRLAGTVSLILMIVSAILCL